MEQTSFVNARDPFGRMYDKIATFLKEQEYKQNARFRLQDMFKDEIRALTFEYPVKNIVVTGVDKFRFLVQPTGDYSIENFERDATKLLARRGLCCKYFDSTPIYHRYHLSDIE